MPKFTVPLIQNLTARADMEVEAPTLKEACLKVESDLDTNGFITCGQLPEFEVDWENAGMPKVDDVTLPDGTIV